MLGATATLEFRLVCDGENPVDAEQKGRAPVGCELYKDRRRLAGPAEAAHHRHRRPAGRCGQTFDQGMPAVSVRLDTKGARDMLETTKANLNKPMAVVFVEQKRDRVERNGQMVEVPREEKEVINIATIRGVFSSNFQITGLDVIEARDLALLLRAGALAAPIYKVEERTVGPSLGQDNIDTRHQGHDPRHGAGRHLHGHSTTGPSAWSPTWPWSQTSILLVALLSLLQASLTLPGIAGIVLTVGMAVDANVLINERIREELRNGNSPQASIHAGYEKAFATIVDSNLTDADRRRRAVRVRHRPVKGFAVVLSLGILTSMFTAVTVSRSLVNGMFGAAAGSSGSPV